MKTIPKHLKDKGVRWVETKDLKNHHWSPRILIAEIPGNTKYKYMCVGEGDEDNFLEGFCYICHPWKYIQEIPKSQEPKKIPYTAETFPICSLFRYKKWEDGCYRTISGISTGGFEANYNNKFFSFSNMDEDIEIGCQVIKDGEIKIEWKPFYKLKEQL